MKFIKLCLDGLSGVGKTYFLTNYLKNKNLTYFNPSSENIKGEINFTRKSIKAFKNETNVIENSLLNQLLIKQFLCNYGYLDIKKYVYLERLIKRNLIYSKAYLHLYLIDSEKKILYHRKKRNREFEYLSDFKHINELDEYLKKNIIKYYEKYEINYLIIDKSNPESLKKIKLIIEKGE